MIIQLINNLPVYISLPFFFVGYILACLGTGLAIIFLSIKTFKTDVNISPATMIASSFILGEGVLAGVWVLLALYGLFSISIVGPILILFITISFFAGKILFVNLYKQIKSIWSDLRKDTWEWQFIGVSTVLIILLWFTSLGRPLFGDGSAFYFAFAKLIAYTKHLIPLPMFIGFTNIGLLGELHYAALMLLHSPEAALLFSLPTILSGGIILAALGRQTGMGRRGQWLTLSIIFTSSAVIWLSADGKVDLFGAAIGLAAYFWAVQIRLKKNFTVFFLTGLFSGYAIIGKLSYILVLIPGIALLVIWGFSEDYIRNKNIKQTLHAFVSGSAIILAGFTLAIIPHLIKNGVLFNNPLSPFGTRGTGWVDQTWFSPELTRRIVLTYPFALTFGSYWAQYGDLSPLILAFLPLAFFLPRPKNFFSSNLFIITATAFLGITIWLVYRPSVMAPRYMLATLLLFTLLPARAAEYVSQNEFKPRLLSFLISVVTPITILATALYFLGITFFPENSIKRYIGAIHDECALDGTYCTGMQKINKLSHPGDRIFHASYHLYWLREDLIQCINPNNELANIISAEGDNFWLELYTHGFSFIFIEKSSFPSVVEKISSTLPPDWVKLSKIYEQDNVLVYKLKFSQPPTDIAPLSCQNNNNPRIWEVNNP